MSRTSAPATPKICPTSVHRPESTLHPPGRRKRFRPAGFPLTESTGRFRLVADESRPRPETPATDPIDPDRLLEPILNRSFRASNVLAGISFRHATWHRDRARVQEALDPTDPDPHAWIRYEHDPDWEGLDPLPFPSDRARRFRQCGERSVVLQHADDPSRYKVACQRCHDRFCLPCMQDRARLIVANLRAQVKYEPTRFLTLTLKHNDAPLAEQLDRLYSSFLCLRRRSFWRDFVTGGVAFLEIKLSSTDDRWHPHLHVLLRGKYVPHKLLSDAWLQITGDSYIVDIRPVPSPDHLYSYLTRYVTKGWDPGMYRKIHALREAIEALKGRKLLASFGNFSGLRLLEPPTSETWVELGTLHETITLAARGVAWAQAACTVLFSSTWEPALCVEPPDE